MSRFIDVLTGDERDRDQGELRLPPNDPLALFHQLKQDSAPAASEARESEISAMKAAVAELRRARELSRRSDEITGELFLPRFAAEAPRLAEEAPRFSRAGAKTRSWRMPAAAALFAALVFFGGDGRQSPPTLAAAAPAPPAATAPALAEGRASYLPLVEDLDPRQAEMIQIEDESMSLVVVLAAGSV